MEFSLRSIHGEARQRSAETSKQKHFWQHAESATNSLRAKKGITHSTKLNTEVRVIYDENVLYTGVRCEEPDMKNSGKRKDSLLFIRYSI